MKTTTHAALPLLAVAFLLPSFPASAQVYDWNGAVRQAPQPRLPPPLTVPEGPVTSWDPLRFEVAFETRTTWLLDDSAKRLAGGRAPMGSGLSLQADILRPDDKVAARLDLGWVTTSATTYQDGSMLTEKLETNLISLGLSARYNLLRWLAPYARIAGGMGWDKITVGNGSGDLHDRQMFGQGSVGAGLSLRSPGLRFWQSPSAPFVGVMGHIEGGYALATGSDFALQASPAGSGANAIATAPVAIGHAGRSAPYLRASFGIAF